MNPPNGDRATAVATASSAGGVGFGGLLAILFIAFKLAGILDWSWWWILAPAWIPGSILLVLLVAGAVVFVGAGVAESRAREKRWRERTGRPQPHEHGPAHRWRTGRR